MVVRGVLAPLAAWTELRPNEAEMGMEPKNEPKRVPRPKAIISWVASVRRPLAVYVRVIKSTLQSRAIIRMSCVILTSRTECFGYGHLFQNSNERNQSYRGSKFQTDVTEPNHDCLIAISSIHRKWWQFKRWKS